MTKPNLYRGKAPLKIPVATIMTFVKLLDDERLLDEFVLSTHKLRINLKPLTAHLNRNRVTAEALPETALPMPTAMAAVRTIHSRFGSAFISQNGRLTVSVAPPVINAAKKFLAAKGIDKRSPFGASIVGDTVKCTSPNQCPHIPGD